MSEGKNRYKTSAFSEKIKHWAVRRWGKYRKKEKMVLKKPKH
jgi:hypothetical protein